MNQQINLYRDPSKRPRKPVDSLHILMAIAALAIVLASWTGWSLWQAAELEREAEHLAGERDVLDQRVAELTADLGALRDARPDPAEIERLRAELEAKRNLFDYLRDGPLAERTGFSGHIEGLARRVVDDLWLSRIRLTEGGRKLRLNGHALDPRRVPEFIGALGEESSYAGHTFRRLDMRRPEDNPSRLDFEVASEPETAGNGRSRR